MKFAKQILRFRWIVLFHEAGWSGFAMRIIRFKKPDHPASRCWIIRLLEADNPASRTRMIPFRDADDPRRETGSSASRCRIIQLLEAGWSSIAKPDHPASPGHQHSIDWLAKLHFQIAICPLKLGLQQPYFSQYILQWFNNWAKQILVVQ